MRRRIPSAPTVTQDGWGVSYTTSSLRSGVVTLHTYKIRESRERRGRAYKVQKGAGYGKRFRTREEAEAWAYEHGYLTDYVIPYCPKCKVRHRWSDGGRTALCLNT